MKNYILFLFAAGILLVSACGSGKDQNGENSTENGKDQTIKDEDKFENRMSAIDNNTELAIANSLSYQNNFGSTEEVAAYLDQSDNILKLEETFSDAKTQNYGKYTFYVENGKKYASKEVYYENTGKKPMFIERITFYDQNEKPIYSKQRTADYEIDLESLPFQITKPKDCSIKRAMQILNQEGEFETTFQGFASDGSMNFLIVGENTENGFASSLAVQHTEGDIAKLMRQEKAYIGTPLEVQYERMVDERDFQFQVLIALTIKDKK